MMITIITLAYIIDQEGMVAMVAAAVAGTTTTFQSRPG